MEKHLFDFSTATRKFRRGGRNFKIFHPSYIGMVESEFDRVKPPRKLRDLW